MLQYRSLLGPVFVLVLVVVAMVWSPFDLRQPSPGELGIPSPLIGSSAIRRGDWADEDWQVFQSKVRWAADRGLDTVPLGAAMVEIGRSFVGTAYVPQTLEAEGPEGLVINFRGLDCVTFVETAFTMARFVRADGAARLVDPRSAQILYENLLRQVRYRDGMIEGYPSRLHYFSDWIADNGRRGLVRDLGRDLGGVLDSEPVNFMTTHAASYRQLGDAQNVAAVGEAEQRLSAQGRWFVPEARIAGVADRIQDGDIIAATSTVQGLDVAHTGLALWVDGSLHLLHAPLVGDSVEISQMPLADRILGLQGQDGIMVARPIAP